MFKTQGIGPLKGVAESPVLIAKYLIIFSLKDSKMKVSSTPLLMSLLYNAIQVAGSACTSDAFPSINSSAFKIAAVREPPANFALPIGLNKTWVDLDLNATIDQAIGIIEEAKTEGVSLLAFPELYFPGYPVVSLCFKSFVASLHSLTHVIGH